MPTVQEEHDAQSPPQDVGVRRAPALSGEDSHGGSVREAGASWQRWHGDASQQLAPDCTSGVVHATADVSGVLDDRSSHAGGNTTSGSTDAQVLGNADGHSGGSWWNPLRTAPPGLPEREPPTRSTDAGVPQALGTTTAVRDGHSEAVLSMQGSNEIIKNLRCLRCDLRIAWMRPE